MAKKCCVMALLMILSIPSLYGKSLGYCPKDEVSACRSSLAAALNIITNCPLDRPRVKECSFILIQTLSEADNKAPFYEGFYEKDFEIGDIEAYKKEIKDLKEYSNNAWHILHNLSKALILYYLDVGTLTIEEKREIENLIQPAFQDTEGRKFDINDTNHRQDFIKRVLAQAQAIEWGAPKEKMVLS